MNPKQLRNWGVPEGQAMRLAGQLAAKASKAGLSKSVIKDRVSAVTADPHAHRNDPHFGELAGLLITSEARTPDDVPKPPAPLRAEPAPYKQWGEDLDANSIEQMVHACQLPVAERAALMPDAHLGYGLPIGGVLATKNAVIPYAVGVDIACRMKMTVLDLPTHMLEGESERLENAIEEETRFGIGAEFGKRGGAGRNKPRDHAVMDEDWNISPVTQRFKDKAHVQLGTSGSGNHFVEFGLFTLEDRDEQLGLDAGTYLALLSHSGSRGTGASVCSHYSKLAMDLHPELPKQLRHLAWLDLDTEAGQEYWQAMNLMGRYAAANHACIHAHVAKNLGAKVIADVENHHNFAWEEEHDGQRMIVHRKGATPAGKGVMGIIPGSMADPGFVVRGKGNTDSLCSASHGAGRVMSRTAAKQKYRWGDAKDKLNRQGVKVISAGLDELPMVYKDIRQVMAQQQDLVDIVGRFDPRLVKMAPGGRAED